jgi:hypothetical protein
MEISKLFNYNMKETFILIKHTNNTCWREKYYIDPLNPKIFCILLRTITKYLEENNIITYQQLITEDDWISFVSSNKKWNIVNRNNNMVLLSCNINIMIELIMYDLGFPPDLLFQ